jgi:hypothetical protein
VNSGPIPALIFSSHLEEGGRTMSNVFGATGVSGAGFGVFGPEPAADPNQPEWMTSFQDTLAEIHEKGFQGYAKDMNEAKLAELRKKILEKMGMSEEELSKMSPEGQAAIEKMIAQEIAQRLAAELEMKAKGKDGTENGIDPNSRASRISSGSNPADKAALAAAQSSAPNGFGPGMTLIRAMEAQDATAAGETHKDL